MSLELIAVQAVSGLALGAVYVLLGIGLALIFGVLVVVNFAHGALFTLGAYAAVYVATHTGSFALGVACAAIFVGAVGLLTERFLIRPLYERGIDYPLLMTFGMTFVVMEALRMAFGAGGIPFNAPQALQGFVELGFGAFPVYRLALIGITAVIVLALWLLIEFTPAGLAIQASARDPEIMTVLGVNVARVRFYVFGLGALLAGLAGGLAAPIQAVTPEMGVPVLVQAFVVTVVGGMGSVTGAVIAGAMVGMAFSLTALVAPQFAELSSFVLMALLLLLRPRGLLGKKGAMG